MPADTPIPADVRAKVEQLSTAARTIRLAVTRFRNTHLTPNGLCFPHVLGVEMEHLDYILDHIQLLINPKYLTRDDAEDQSQRPGSAGQASAGSPPA